MTKLSTSIFVRPARSTLALLGGLLLSACVLQDLDEDLEHAQQDYGYFKGRITGPDNSAKIQVLFVRDDGGNDVVEEVRTIRYDETFYALVVRADYTVVAFEDTNGDFAYQPGEPAAQVRSPTVNWFSGMSADEPLDPDTLPLQEIGLSENTVLDREYDLSHETVKELTKGAANFLRVVYWDEENFSDENVQLGMWQPIAFEENVGFGLYLLEEFDPGKKSVVLVHGISDSPRVFRELAAAIPDDYQLLLFHYPSSFPLNFTSYVLDEALDELLQRYDIPQIDVIAHSMGGLVSKGMIYQADALVRDRLRIFVSIASPFGGHSAAAHGIKWAPVIAPVWWAMAPGSSYLQKIASVDLSGGPDHHLIYTYSHETGGERKDDDGVVSVESQLDEAAQANATAVYGFADSHTGVMRNDDALRLVATILEQ